MTRDNIVWSFLTQIEFDNFSMEIENPSFISKILESKSLKVVPQNSPTDEPFLCKLIANNEQDVAVIIEKSYQG